MLAEPLVRIRRAKGDDVAALMDLERACSTAAHWTEKQYWDLFRPGTVQRLVLIAQGTEAGSETEGSGRAGLAGFLVARHLAPEWELENVVVAPAARRKGVGERLLQALLTAARETNSNSVFLEVRESNIAARGLYEKLGFYPSGRRKSYYRNRLEDAVLYSLTLR